MGVRDFEAVEESYAEPPSISDWNIQTKEQTKYFTYGDHCDTLQEIHDLRALEDFVHKIISFRDEYQTLPNAIDGY